MRLTLRTLLAYRDGVLKPSDYENLHQRIQQSQDAANLLSRIEGLSQELQPASTTIVGKGLGDDPNFLAEYLDDALHSEKVPEFERVCLQSNSYLAELADCHHLLATAMHTHVHLSDELRQSALAVGRPENRERIKADLRSRRQRRLPPATEANSASTKLQKMQGVDANSVASSEQGHPVQVHAPMLASGGESIKQQGLNLEGAGLTHEVPEYLVGASRHDWKIPTAFVVLLILLVVLLRVAIGPIDRLGELFRGDVQTASDLRAQEAVGNKPQAEPREVDTPALEIQETNEAPPFGQESDSDEAASESPDETAGRSEAGAEDVDEGKPIDLGPSTASDGESSENNSTPLVGSGDVVEAQARDSDAELAADAQTGKIFWEPEANEFPALLLANLPDGEVKRVEPGAPVPMGETLVVAPQSIVTLKFPDSLTWKIFHASRVRVNEKSIEIDYGRGMLGSEKPNELRLQTRVGDFLLQMGANTTVAIDLMHRRETHGSILEPSVFRPTLIVVAVDGGVTIRAEDAERATNLQIGEGLAMIEGLRAKDFKLQSIPAWYRLSPSRAIDREGLLELTQAVNAVDSPTALRRLLRERSQSFRPEEAAVAIQTSMLLGNFEPLLQSGFLANPRMSIHWQPTLGLFRQMLPIFPDKLDATKQAFLDAFPDGNKIFAMLVGLSAEQAAAGGLSKLIDELASPELVNRVVAFQELQRLTAKKLGFQPAEPNRASILMWRRELATENLDVVPVGDMIWERRLP